MHRAPSQEDEDEGGHGGDTKDKISWSYSSYMAALHKEDILNNTDESTFSSLMSDTGNSFSVRIQTGCTAEKFHWNLTLTKHKVIFYRYVYFAIAWSFFNCLLCFVSQRNDNECAYFYRFSSWQWVSRKRIKRSDSSVYIHRHQERDKDRTNPDRQKVCVYRKCSHCCRTHRGGGKTQL